ncbi:MAG: hypothetical protein GF393_11880 [Armatimonadia bacterium]|nr:hypothetical protein [Armatimonadia bacterium]
MLTPCMDYEPREFVRSRVTFRYREANMHMSARHPGREAAHQEVGMMRKWRTLLIAALALTVTCTIYAGEQPASLDGTQIAQLQLQRELQLRLPQLSATLLKLPDLTIRMSGPDQAVAGEEISLKIQVDNKGAAPAAGTQGTPPNTGYMVDLVLSQDSHIPMEMATQPVYQGYGEDDFVEDMLMLGGRISNTQSVAAGGTRMYSAKVPIPLNTEPGVYCLAGVVDPGKRVLEWNEGNNIFCLQIRVAGPQEENVQVPPGTDRWVMPWGVGGTRLDRIKASGLTDYGPNTDAPFGWRLGLRHGYDNEFPLWTGKYYRWLYRVKGSGDPWTELTEAVKAHYVKEQGGDTTFPVYSLGPRGVAGMNLYEFRPHNAPEEPGATTYWPTTDFFGDIYSGFFDTRTLPDGLYEVKLEVYQTNGDMAVHGTHFNFIVPTGTLPNGTVTTAPAPASSIQGGGFVFDIRVSNTPCGASIDAPKVGQNTEAGQCGFLLYDPSVTETDNAAKVTISYHATHPDNYARFRFRIVRGSTTPFNVADEITATTVTPFSGNGSGTFANAFTRSQLLGPNCPVQAAFSLNLHTIAKHTNGWSRLHRYDAHDVRAFALAPGASGGGTILEELQLR